MSGASKGRQTRAPDPPPFIVDSHSRKRARAPFPSSKEFSRSLNPKSFLGTSRAKIPALCSPAFTTILRSIFADGREDGRGERGLVLSGERDRWERSETPRRSFDRALGRRDARTSLRDARRAAHSCVSRSKNLSRNARARARRHFHRTTTNGGVASAFVRPDLDKKK